MLRRLFSKDAFLVFILAFGILLLILWPRISVTIQPGHVGVFFNRLFGGTDLTRTYKEGLHLFLPWNSITPYDCRLQKENYTVPALAQGGLEVTLEITAIWSIDHRLAAQLHVMAGPGYKDRMVTPPVISAVRFIIGGFQQEGLYDLMLSGDIDGDDDNNARTRPGRIDGRQAKNLRTEILEQARVFMKESVGADENTKHPLHLIDIQVRRIILPDTLRQAIDKKFVAEQEIFAERYRVLQAYERYKSRYIDSQAVRMNQRIIGDGLTESYLRHEGIAATKELAASKNAKLVLIGGKDGLPLLLNPDSLKDEGGDNAPDGGSAPETPDAKNSPIGDDAVAMPPPGESWALDYDLLNRSLEQLEDARTKISPGQPLDRALPKVDQVGGLSVDETLKKFHNEPAPPPPPTPPPPPVTMKPPPAPKAAAAPASDKGEKTGSAGAKQNKKDAK